MLETLPPPPMGLSYEYDRNHAEGSMEGLCISDDTHDEVHGTLVARFTGPCAYEFGRKYRQPGEWFTTRATVAECLQDIFARYREHNRG